MPQHERWLPHYHPPDATLFLTWRLFGSLKFLRPDREPNPGKAFAVSDRLLDTTTTGARWLKDERIAGIVPDALEHGETEYNLYERSAWVIMPNHVHMAAKLFQPLPKVMRWLKGSTARAANLILGRTGKPFWQYETYDHCIRDTNELNRVIRYIERNPVRAGLADSIEDWPWSSASTKGAGRRPTLHEPAGRRP